MKKIFLLVLIVLPITLFSQIPHNKLTDILAGKLSALKSNEEVLIWVFFTDKEEGLLKSFSGTTNLVSSKSLERRKKVLPSDKLIDVTDLPVNGNYIKSIEDIGGRVKQKSKWFNAISIYIAKSQIDKIISLNFVKSIDVVYQLPKQNKSPLNNNTENKLLEQPEGINSYNYGPSLTQLQQINVPAVHNTGNTGQGVTIAVMDAGFNLLSHECFSSMKIIAKWDFVNNGPNVGDSVGLMGSGAHGTQTLSTIGGFKEGELIGPAFSSSFILAKTENTDSETPIEEDNWIAAAEWADSIGVDVTSTSLGYLTFDPPFPSYTWQSMDGKTCIITIGASMAAKKGIVVVNSAGNNGFDSTHNTLNAPADGDSVITVGAVTSTGAWASFSSVGNTVDGRIKPDVMAMGSNDQVADPTNTTGYTSGTGTSFSCPLAAGVAALILSHNIHLTPMQVREAMRNTSSNENSPNRIMGWGILDAYNAIRYCDSVLGVKTIVSPSNFILYQNYPNPFNPSTIISYQIAAPLNPANGTLTKVELNVYDILGRKIITLVNGNQNAGNYKVELNASNLPSGVYFYQLHAGNYIETKKMILLR
jgi:subtilisin family serine protease